jgi:hypothetical protein
VGSSRKAREPATAARRRDACAPVAQLLRSTAGPLQSAAGCPRSSRCCRRCRCDTLPPLPLLSLPPVRLGGDGPGRGPVAQEPSAASETNVGCAPGRASRPSPSTCFEPAPITPTSPRAETRGYGRLRHHHLRPIANSPVRTFTSTRTFWARCSSPSFRLR